MLKERGGNLADKLAKSSDMDGNVDATLAKTRMVLVSIEEKK